MWKKFSQRNQMADEFERKIAIQANDIDYLDTKHTMCDDNEKCDKHKCLRNFFSKI